MTATKDSLATAQESARDARTRLAATIAEIRARLQPDVLARQGIDRLRESSSAMVHRAVDSARARPAVAGSIGAALLLLVLRRPIARLIGRLFFRRDETDRPADQLSDRNRM